MAEPSEIRVTSATLLIDVQTQEYPVSLSTIFSRFSGRSYPAEPLLSDIQALGYAVVENTVIPTGDVVTEGPPVLVDGVWKRTWNARLWNAEELAEQLAKLRVAANNTVMEVRETDFETGMPYEFEGQTYHVQLRTVDRINLLVMNLLARGIVGTGIPEGTLLPFRTYENKTLLLTSEQMVDLTNMALNHLPTLYIGSWAIKDLIDAAEEFDQIPSIPPTFFQ